LGGQRDPHQEGGVATDALGPGLKVVQAIPAKQRIVGRPRRDATSAGERLPVVAEWHALQHGAHHRAARPALPIAVIEQKQLEHLRVLGFLVASCRNGAEVLVWGVRYSALIRTPGRGRSADRRSSFTSSGAARQARPISAIASATRPPSRCSCARCACSRRPPAAEASFLHPPPPTTEAHDAFFGCRVRFGATSAGFALDRGIVDGMIPSASNPALKAFLIEHAEALRKRIHVGADLTGEVRAALLDRLLEGDCEMTSISRHLGNHPRTLRRRLKEEGTSFQALLDDARREHALRLLQTASVTEVALSLGFSETSAFTRAFRRWMRLPPRAYRARQAAAQ
jgi:AraC-like DNA-binding protein